MNELKVTKKLECFVLILNEDGIREIQSSGTFLEMNKSRLPARITNYLSRYRIQMKREDYWVAAFLILSRLLMFHRSSSSVPLNQFLPDHGSFILLGDCLRSQSELINTHWWCLMIELLVQGDRTQITRALNLPH